MRSEEDGAQAGVQQEKQNAEDEDEEAEEVEVAEGDQVEGSGDRSVFSIAVPNPSETSGLLSHSGADDGKRVDESQHPVEEEAPPPAFSHYVDEMLQKVLAAPSHTHTHTAHSSLHASNA